MRCRPSSPRAETQAHDPSALQGRNPPARWQFHSHTPDGVTKTTRESRNACSISRVQRSALSACGCSGVKLLLSPPAPPDVGSEPVRSCTLSYHGERLRRRPHRSLAQRFVPEVAGRRSSYRSDHRPPSTNSSAARARSPTSSASAAIQSSAPAPAPRSSGREWRCSIPLPISDRRFAGGSPTGVRDGDLSQSRFRRVIP